MRPPSTARACVLVLRACGRYHACLVIPSSGGRMEIPGPRSRELVSRGDFDLQAPYRALVVDDARSRGTTLVDVDGNEILDLFASFALGALGYNHPALVAAASTPDF